MLSRKKPSLLAVAGIHSNRCNNIRRTLNDDDDNDDDDNDDNDDDTSALLVVSVFLFEEIEQRIVLSLVYASV